MTASVVLLAYHFPPDPAVGSLRAAKVARAFREAGYRVDVVTAQLPGETSPRASEDSGLRVHPVKPLPPPREVLVRLKTWLRAPRYHTPGDTGPGPTAGWVPEAHVAAWKRLLASLLWLPDDRQGFVIPALRTARGLVRDGTRLVYSTAPPYSPHLVGVALRSRRGVRWIMELRDPWADNDQKPWWVRTRVTDALDARLERYCLERADLVVTVSEGIRARLLARMPSFDQSRLVVVRNGIERLAPAARFGHRGGPVRITYVGTFYYSRDPRPFLRGLAAVRRTHGLGPEQIRVDFTPWG
jgi:Glycosyl transferase 4-like domain